jgi:hypothetical protein
MTFAINRPSRLFTSRDLLRSHPLVRNLALLTFPGNGAVNLVTGEVPSSFAGFTTVVDTYGPSSKIAQGTNNCISYSVQQIVPNGSQTSTMLAIAKPPSVSRVTEPIRIENAANTGLIDLLFNSDTAGSAAAGTWSARWYSGGNEASTQFIGGIDGAFHCFSSSRIGNLSSQAYQDGLPVGTQDNNGGSGFTGPSSVYVSGYGGIVGSVDLACDYPVLLCAVWTRALSGLEQIQFATNPWQIFRPPQLAWSAPKFAPSAAAPFVPYTWCQDAGQQGAILAQ